MNLIFRWFNKIYYMHLQLVVSYLHVSPVKPFKGIKHSYSYHARMIKYITYITLQLRFTTAEFCSTHVQHAVLSTGRASEIDKVL